RPDHILQYAQYLAQRYAYRYDLEKPIVKADVYVSLNARTTQRLIDNTIDLSQEKRHLGHYSWILPFEN
ncbi:MAG: HTTM domain-containing protein, partial [Saprospiraceae bacterium]|nr:HTTM domain-containing protein [Saprospiraceae bacterium]